jgi:DNA-binding SARP family transcriptional activator
LHRLEQDLVGVSRGELLAETAEMELLVGDAGAGLNALRRVDGTPLGPSAELVDLAGAISSLRDGDYAAAVSLLRDIPADQPGPYPGYKSCVRAFEALALALAGDGEARKLAEAAAAAAQRQGARPWWVVAHLASHADAASISSALATIPREVHFAISFAAELVAAGLDRLDSAALDLVQTLATQYGERWRPALRRQIQQESSSALPAGRILDVVGESADIPLLRRLAKGAHRTPSDKQLGRGLARRLAPRAAIHDLGRVRVEVGVTEIGSNQIRRKVLALLCFLLTRPRWAATREEVMEAMWPDIDPSSAINSLNQSVYFLRRVFEPNYSDETTAGYIHQDSDLLWLDGELIESDSRECAGLIERYEREGDPAVAVSLAERYQGRFALDFAYEDWSADYREWLHVAWLHVIERQIRLDIDASRFDRGVGIARRALAIEPRNDELELSMLKLLRRAGLHTAAAEQYNRYSNVLRTEIGVEPPELETV